MSNFKAWSWFALVQLVSLIATISGWLILIPFCLAQAWTADAHSIKDATRVIDRWSWKPLNKIYGNPEDGVSGQQALVWISGVNSPYMPTARASWRAYCWSAWRNSADNLKYVFAWKDGPLKKFTLFGKTHNVGWKMENGFNVPVIS